MVQPCSGIEAIPGAWRESGWSVSGIGADDAGLGNSIDAADQIMAIIGG